MENNLKEIKEANGHISVALSEWSNILAIADADEWAYYLEYSEEDLLNALYIFNHVAQNIAIKKGYYKDDADAVEKILKFKEGVKEGFGFDTIELTKSVLGF